MRIIPRAAEDLEVLHGQSQGHPVPERWRLGAAIVLLAVKVAPVSGNRLVAGLLDGRGRELEPLASFLVACPVNLSDIGRSQIQDALQVKSDASGELVLEELQPLLLVAIEDSQLDLQNDGLHGNSVSESRIPVKTEGGDSPVA
jgi:hypothetical protein